MWVKVKSIYLMFLDLIKICTDEQTFWIIFQKKLLPLILKNGAKKISE